MRQDHRHDGGVDLGSKPVAMGAYTHRETGQSEYAKALLVHPGWVGSQRYQAGEDTNVAILSCHHQCSASSLVASFKIKLHPMIIVRRDDIVICKVRG